MTYGAQRIELFSEIINNYNCFESLDLTKDNDILRVVLGLVLATEGGVNIINIYGLPAIEADEELVLIEPYINGKRFSTCSPQGNLYEYEEVTVRDLLGYKAHSLSLIPVVYKINISTVGEYANTMVFKGSKLTWKIEKEYIVDA